MENVAEQLAEMFGERPTNAAYRGVREASASKGGSRTLVRRGCGVSTVTSRKAVRPPPLQAVWLVGVPRFLSAPSACEEQMAQVRLRWPHLTCQIRYGMLVCDGPVQPTAASRTYTIRIEYRVGATSTLVTSPRLERRGSAPNQPIPHTYNSTRQGREATLSLFSEVGRLAVGQVAGGHRDSMGV